MWMTKTDLHNSSSHTKVDGEKKKNLTGPNHWTKSCRHLMTAEKGRISHPQGALIRYPIVSELAHLKEIPSQENSQIWKTPEE